MTYSLFLTQVDHCRSEPVVHRFRYTSLSLLVDLDELDAFTRAGRFFGYNRAALFSIRDRDYLRGETGSIKEKLCAYLRRSGCDTDFARIELLTSPRFLGYVFNPVSFYLCYRVGKQKPDICVAEVNNTFGESHLYITEPDAENLSRRVSKYSAAKEFHVSPFYDRQGSYEFFVERGESSVDIRVNLLRSGKTEFTSGVKGRLDRPGGVLRSFVRGIRYGWLTLPRIVWQAARLRFQRGLPVFAKPIPDSDWTIGQRSPTVFERLAQNIMSRYFRQLRTGELTVELPSGDLLRFGDPGAKPAAKLRVRDWRFFTRILFGGDVAFGESYTEGLFDSPDLPLLLGVFAENVKHFNDRDIPFTKILQRLNAWLHRKRANTKHGSKHNIAAHYDLGNELFRRFLDERLVYSCAVFENAGDSLETAQLNKLRKIISKARIRPEHRVLEIGSGWGAFAIEAAKETGCHVTTITLSEEQFEETKRKIESEGLSGRVEVLLCDYRAITGRFDRIVSIEMLEAVGHEQLGLFFEICDRLLEPDGLIALQFITVPDQNYERYRRSCDWIQKYIFPGGHCPSLTAVCNAATAHSPFLVEEVENIGPSYASTLREWRKRFHRSAAELAALGYDERFRRMWEYYLSYCEAGFATRYLGTLQLVLTRPSNAALGTCPRYAQGGTS